MTARAFLRGDLREGRERRLTNAPPWPAYLRLWRTRSRYDRRNLTLPRAPSNDHRDNNSLPRPACRCGSPSCTLPRPEPPHDLTDAHLRNWPLGSSKPADNNSFPRPT